MTHLYILLLGMMGLMAASCARESALLETVPANVNSVAVVNVNQLVKDLGIKVKPDGTAVVPQNLKFKDRITPQQIAMMIKAKGAVDLNHVAVARMPRGEQFVTSLVLDSDSLERALTAYGCQKFDKDGYSLYVDNGYSIATNGRQLWLVDSDVNATVDLVERTLKSAKEQSINDVDGVDKMLNESTLCNMAVNLGGFNADKGGDTWLCFTANVKNNTLQGNLNIINADGSPVEVKGLQRLDTSILMYAPADAMIVGMAGFTPDVDWESALDFAALVSPRSSLNAAYLEMLLPYLQKINGTAMVAVSPKEGTALDASTNPFEGMDFIAMLHMTQDDVNATLGAATEFAAKMGAVRKVEEGLYLIDAPGQQVYVGNIDGCFTIATRKPTNRNGSSLAGRFTGKKGGFSLNTPSMQAIGGKEPYGIDLVVTSGESSATYTLKLNNSSAPILETLLR